MKMEREKLVLLVTAAQGGDAAALDELFSAFYNSVYYFALKTVEDEHTAADVTQETFIEVFSTLGKLKEPAAFVSWLKMITYHQCTRYFKKKKDVIVDEYEDGSSIFDTIADEDEEFLPDAALNQAELRATVMEMIDKLSAEQRAAVMMFYYDELSVKEIAKIQGVSENTVKSRLNYARQSIKRSVEAYEKRTGIKLRCAGVLPLLLWLFRGYFGGELSASAAAVAEGVSAATGTVLSAASVAPAATAASAGAAASAATTAAAASATAATAAAKAVGVPLVAKIIAGIAAAVIAIGGASAAVLLSGDHVHAYTATVVREASCEADGEQKFTCECGESYTDGKDLPDEHTHDYTVKNTDSKYFASAADCENAAVYYKSCAVCGLVHSTETFTYGELKPHTLVYVAAKPATTTEAGNIEYWYCSVCGKCFTDAEGKNEILNTVIEIGRKVGK